MSVRSFSALVTSVAGFASSGVMSVCLSIEAFGLSHIKINDMKKTERAIEKNIFPMVRKFKFQRRFNPLVTRMGKKCLPQRVFDFRFSIYPLTPEGERVIHPVRRSDVRVSPTSNRFYSL